MQSPVNWEPSKHEGLLTLRYGNKQWYQCSACSYFNDRLYHTKMHFQRIHVNLGREMNAKRKFMDTSVIFEGKPKKSKVLHKKPTKNVLPIMEEEEEDEDMEHKAVVFTFGDYSTGVGSFKSSDLPTTSTSPLHFPSILDDEGTTTTTLHIKPKCMGESNMLLLPDLL